MTSDKWRPLVVTLIVIAAIFAAVFILEVFNNGGGMGIAHGSMMRSISSWHMGGCMR